MAEFFAMGGYAVYVWGSYAIAVVVLGGLVIATLRGLRTNEALLAHLEPTRSPRRARQRRQAAAGDGGGAESSAAYGSMNPATAGADCGADGGGGGGGDC